MLISVLDSVLVHSWSLCSSFLTEGGEPGGPGAVWLVAWLGLAGPCWGLAGHGRDLAGPRQQPTGIPVGFVRLQSIGNLEITNYQLNPKNSEYAVFYNVFGCFGV